MYKAASQYEISLYLIKLKKLITEDKFDFVPRSKNMQSLAKLNMTIPDAKDEILGMIPENYYKGPKKDYDVNRPGEIWEFKKIIDNERFYIKMKITEQDGETIAKCIGFHEDNIQQER